MEITWAAVGKVMLAGIGTYIFLPAFLVLRDVVLWWAINRFILNKKAQVNVRRYVNLVNEWNTKYAGYSSISSDETGSRYTVNGQIVTEGDFIKCLNREDVVLRELRALKVDLDRRARFLRWLLKHYHQDIIDPINEWKKEEERRL